MKEYRETIEPAEVVSVVSRHSPTPMPSTVIRREEFGADGNLVKVVSRRRVYWNGYIEDITSE